MDNSLEPHDGLREASSDFAGLLSITHLMAAATTVTPEGAIEVHSTSPTLVHLPGRHAVVCPGDTRLQQGDVILLPPSVTYRIADPDSGAPPDIAVVDINFTIYGLEARYLLPQFPHVFREEHAVLLRDDVRTICHMDHSTSDIAVVAGRLAVGYRIIGTICTALELNQPDAMTHQTHEQLRSVLSYLRKNYHLPLTIEDIADACHMSSSLLFKLVPRIGNTTPMQLLKKIRLEESLALLRRDAMTIGQIAQAVGFVDANNFSREFKKEYGITARQYRQTNVLGVQAGEIYKKAEAMFEKHEFRRAAALYKRVISAAPNWKNADQLYYKTGLACHAAGDVTDADAYWSKVSSLHYRLLVRLRNTSSADDLRDIYQDGDASIREEVAEKAVDLMHRSSSAEKFAAARQYSPLCKDLAPDHPSTHARLAEALLDIGDFTGVLDCCPDQEYCCARAMRSTGLYQEHLDHYPHLRPQCASALRWMNNTDAVLAEYSDLPGTCVSALVQAGRAEEAVTRFPQHCAPALLSLGRYDEILDRFPEDREYVMWALALKGEAEKALRHVESSPDLRANLLLFLESTDELTKSDLQSFFYRQSAFLLRALHLIERGEYTAALETLHGIKHIDHPEFKPGDYQTDLLIPFAISQLPAENRQAVQSSWPDWRIHYQSIIRNHRYYASQQLWHDVAYICGEIDADQYHAQPHRIWSNFRFMLVKAIKAECSGSQSEALSFYRDYLDETDASRSIYWHYTLTLPANRAFARWRATELQT